ncbi:MAG: Rieske 2Fe-2S domain-containing protein [Candidatus Lustribacter sp.]|jgi:phenylpropionate dioxygenase-like ring-hydroxylating dioxygenase large terminal subunit
MLTKEDNELITRVGPDTQGGALLRRFWYPVLKAEALEPDGAPKKVRLLGENFVAFRSGDGRVGMLEELCPHRRASLVLARNEECGLRCLFHGWKLDLDGRVVDAPSEPSDRVSFVNKVRTRRVAVRENSRLIWAYIGPGEPPPFPAFEFTTLPLEHIQIAEVPGRCNWVQLAEGQLDSAHISHLHASASANGLARLAQADRAPRYEVEPTPWGMHAAAIRAIGENERYTRVTEFVMPSWEFIPRPTAPGTREYDDMPRFVVHQTPVDDVTTIVWYINWHPERPISYAEARWCGWNDEYLQVIDEPLMGQDRTKMKAGHMTGINNLLTEDMIVAETMGPIADRTGEYLGSSDAAVARFRRLFIEAIRDQERGAVPRGCGGTDHYHRLGGLGVLHPADVDWRDCVGDLVR